MRQSACLVVNPITVNNFASLFNCTPVGRSSDSMMALSSYTLHGQLLEAVDSRKYLGVPKTYRGLSISLTQLPRPTVLLVTASCGGTSKTAPRRLKQQHTLQLCDQFWSMRLLWDHHHQSDINTLDQVQRRAARYVLLCHRHDP